MTDDSRSKRLVAGLVLGAALFLFCFTMVFGRRASRDVEHHLVNDARAALRRDFAQLSVTGDGRQIAVSGTVATTAERDLVVGRLSRRWGVASVSATRLRVAAKP